MAGSRPPLKGLKDVANVFKKKRKVEINPDGLLKSVRERQQKRKDAMKGLFPKKKK